MIRPFDQVLVLSRRRALAAIAALGAAACGGSSRVPPPSSALPNFVVFFTDDHGFADLGIHGARGDVRTPFIDQLARDGALLRHGYVTAPQCSPSRAGLLTGIHQNRFAYETNADGPLQPEQVTIAERLKAAGYVTGMAGKWHLGIDSANVGNVPQGTPASKYYAASQGFDEYYEGTIGRFIASHNTHGQPVVGAPREVYDSSDRTEAATRWALAFIRRHARQPFFLYVPYFAPHVPLGAPESYVQRFPAVTDQTRRLALAMLAAIDDGVGAIRAEVDRVGIANSTMILFVSDNGAPLGPAWNGSLNEPLVGEKGMLTDGGIRVPFVAAWPGRIPSGQVVDVPVSALDVAPTLLTASGLAVPDDIDGVDLLPLLDGRVAELTRDALYWRWGTQAAVRRGAWKLLLLGNEKQLLFDMTQPDAESRDLAAAYPEIVVELRERLFNWAAGLPRPGLPDSPLNAHDRTLYRRHGLI